MTLHLTLTNFGWVCLPLEYVNAVLNWYWGRRPLPSQMSKV